jgi:beta-xylosidase
MLKLYFSTFLYILPAVQYSSAQSKIPEINSVLTAPYASRVWLADLGNGQYKNPVLHADYSDPDAIRVGEDYFMTASSFDAVPGLPILHSKDLVNWSLISHALPRQVPVAHFSSTQHGNGVWAPAIRYHLNEFYIYYPDPDFGIYMIKAANPSGKWSEPVLVAPGKGLIDPCPLWDNDGKAYLAYAYAGSRAGIKSILAVMKLNRDGTRVLDQGRIIYDGHAKDPTIEGPKLYKRNGYYYVFAPAGGVATGWQLVLRAKNIYGPYERRVVMDQGNTAVNGPHQGAWVNTPAGEDWFLHFQDKGAYGRVVHLQPMKWVADWPVIGIDENGDGKGAPVLSHRKPKTGKVYPLRTPPESDEFNTPELGLQWQWQANPAATWSFLYQGGLRLYTVKAPDSARNLWDVPNLLLQKFPAEQFMVTAKMKLVPNQKLTAERAGLIIMGYSYAGIGLKSTGDGVALVMFNAKAANKGAKEKEEIIKMAGQAEVYLRVKVSSGAICQFSYSLDGENFIHAEGTFIAEEGQWIGAKVGLFASRLAQINDAGYADFDWFRIEPLR